MKTDIEIASEAVLAPIKDIAKKIAIEEDSLFCYGKYIAKVRPADSVKKGKLVLVSAINPTASGEGKTTVSIGLADGLNKLSKSVALALREPSLGPVFGFKGGAAGGGYAQIAPMENINLHFTGDLHAITAANNLLCAMIDNHIYWGNELNIKEVTFHRCMDVNDRSLRNMVVGLGFTPREDSVDITAASEVMAIFCLAKNIDDLKKRLAQIIIGYDKAGKILRASDLKAEEAMTILLKDALLPNLVQTLEGTPAFVHGGPFANIAHGCNSIIATKTALSYADYVITEAGFGADLGAEKFLDIKCREGEISPSAVVIVATVKALKCSGGKKDNLTEEDDEALIKGLGNLEKHIENIKNVFKLPCIVAINKFLTDRTSEIELIQERTQKIGAKTATTECFTKGGEGAIALAQLLIEELKTPSTLSYAYDLCDRVEKKITDIAVKIYGANSVIFSEKAKKSLAKIYENNFDKLPICIAKTQYSLSDNPLAVGRPIGFDINVRDISIRAGAGFLVAQTGDILLMPGLARVPNAEKMSINGDEIKGLF